MPGSPLIPRVEEWETASGASFQPDKTALIHFTRTPSRLEDRTPLCVKGQRAEDSWYTKILGIMLDQQLRYDIFTAWVAKWGLRVAMALRRLRGLRPRTVRQLFIFTVAPVVDYTSPLWSQEHRQGWKAWLTKYRGSRQRP